MIKPEEAVAKKAALPEAPKAEEAVAEKEAKPKAVKAKNEVTEVAPEEAATSNIKAPEVEVPKVINKIDLSQIDSSTRPKKSAKKPLQAHSKRSHTSSGNANWAPIKLCKKFRFSTRCPKAKAPPISQYSTVGFHLMKVSS